MEAIELEKTTQRTEGPGKLLTDARLKLGLEPQNVAEMLHLREYQIRALEADDFENLPEPTYVKGYLRAYCQLLSLDPEKIIKMYSDSVQPPVRESFEGLATEKQAASNDNLVKLVSIAMVALVAGLAVTFWLTSREPESTDTPDAGSVETSASETPQVPTTVIDEPEKTRETSAAPEHSAEPSSPEVAKPEPAPVLKPEPQSPGATAEAEKSASPPVAPPAPAPIVTEKQEAPPPAPVTSSEGISKETSLLPETDASAHSRLLIKVMQESWVDIRDAKGNKLIYESVPAGREIPLEGLAPFSIFLGNAAGVQVFLNGKAYDFSSYRRGLTARFKLSAKSGTQ
jgi:cytoskeleton protein RodZ